MNWGLQKEVEVHLLQEELFEEGAALCTLTGLHSVYTNWQSPRYLPVEMPEYKQNSTRARLEFSFSEKCRTPRLTLGFFYVKVFL